MIQRMVCTGCGAEANASCNCGKPYVPKAVRAAEAIKANPKKSDRAIAADIGVAPNTVKAARDELRSAAQLEDAPRTGLDGKTRRLPRISREEMERDRLECVALYQKVIDAETERDAAIKAVVTPQPDPPDPDPEEEVEPRHYREAFFIRATESWDFAKYSGPVDDEVVAMARRVAHAWNELANALEARK